MRANLKDNLIAGVVVLLLGSCLGFAHSIENRLDSIEKQLVAIDVRLPATTASLLRKQ